MTAQPPIPVRPPSHALRLYTAISIVAGLAALVVASLLIPLHSPIAIRAVELAGRDRLGAGLAFWIVLGLSGSLRSTSMGGHAILTFHLPFVVAAMLLGGPTAGAWVAFISTLELREIREVPWYGTLANHSVAALGAVAGGLAADQGLGVASQVVAADAAVLVAGVVGALVFGAITIGMAAVTMTLREGLTFRETLAVFDSSWRRTIAAECVVAWILAYLYGAIGWWAPVVCDVLVILVWQAYDDRDQVSHDDMTGLLNRHGLMIRLAASVARVRRSGVPGLLVMLDLDGFKAINDSYGHEAGDEVLQVVGERLQSSIRVTDAAARLGGDEFMLVLPGIRDAGAARALAERIHAHLAEPIFMGDRELQVGSSIGVVAIDGRPHLSLLRLIAEADRAMYAAKRSGGGVFFAEPAAAKATLMPSPG